MSLFADRKIRKAAKDVLHHARHLRNMREDVMPPQDLEKLTAGIDALRDAIKQRDIAAMEERSDKLYELALSLIPKRLHPRWRENTEVLVVAIAVAMGVRTYFAQPFKIPTGSMQPTLYGITSVERDRHWTDLQPIKPLKWLITGDWYREVRVRSGGRLRMFRVNGRPSNALPGEPFYPHDVFVQIGPDNRKGRYRIPAHIWSDFMKERVSKAGPGSDPYVFDKGELLWAGSRTAGDHVFVDKISWNFRKPRRGDVMVFSTEGIQTLPQGTHYIKRLVGEPGDRLAIDPPRLLVNGERVSEPEGIRRMVEMDQGREGYKYYGDFYGGTEVAVGQDEYFAFGDNSGNSRDSRAWGGVPSKNMVGPAFIVYWPFVPINAYERPDRPRVSRFGLIR